MNIQERAQKVLAEIDVALAMAEKATPGPWEHVVYAKPESDGQPAERTDQVIAEDCRESDPVLFETWNGEDDDIGNLRFIAASRTLLPASLRMLKTAIEGLLKIQPIDLSPCNGGSCMVATDASDIADANNSVVSAALATLCNQWGVPA